MFCILDDNISVLDTTDGVVEVVSKAELEWYKEKGIVFHDGLPSINLKDGHIDVQDLDRTEAVIMIKGKCYTSSTHQECLYDLELEENGTDIYVKNGLDPSVDDIISPFTDTTYNLFENCELYGFDIYEDKYLVAHNIETAQKTLDWMLKYAGSRNLEPAVFRDYISDLVSLMDI